MIHASRSFRKSVTSMVALGLVLSGGLAGAPLLAQTDPLSGLGAGAGEQSTSGQLNLPANPEFFGKNDPNNRRATAIINGEIVTGTDVDQRLALILAANGNKVSDEEKERLRLQILRNLIDETLQIQEAKAAKIDITDDEVNETYARISQQNFQKSPTALAKYLASVGSAPASLKRQIKGELAWQRLLRRNVQPYINIAAGEVQEMMARLKAAKGTEEYRLGEIFLSANDENKAQVAENAKKIVEQLKKGGSFVAYARQYSQASTAAVGGDLGFIRLAQLPAELSTVAQQMNPGTLAGPVPIPGGFSILYLIDKRQVLTADPRDAVLSLKQISLDFPKGTTKDEAQKRASLFAKTMSEVKGCGAADEAARGVGAAVVENDNVKGRDLPTGLQDLVLKLSVGQVTPPFGSLEEGVRVLMLCGRDDPQVAEGPSFEQIQTQMEDDRVNKRAQAYLRDLRRDAIIEYN